MSLREIMDLKNKQKKAYPTTKALDVAKMFYDENSHIIGTPSPQKFEQNGMKNLSIKTKF